MKNWRFILAGAIVCAAQTAVYDTSIVKVGNSWKYDHRYQTPGNPTLHTGAQRLEIISRSSSGDSLVFHVARFDSTLRYIKMPEMGIFDSTVVITRDTTRYAFLANVFYPGPPLFLKDQAFTGFEQTSVYGGTARLRKQSSASGCAGFEKDNLQGVGLLVDYSLTSCGTRYEHSRHTLTAFKDVPFDRSMVTSLRASFPTLNRTPGAKGRMHQGRVSFGLDGRSFDLEGRRIPEGIRTRRAP